MIGAEVLDFFAAVGSSESEASEIAVILSESISVSSAASTLGLGTVRRCGALLAACCLLERSCGGINKGAVFLAKEIVRKKSLLSILLFTYGDQHLLCEQFVCI